MIYPHPVKFCLYNWMRAFNKILALECTSFSYKCCDCNACLFCNAASETPTVFLQALQGSQRLDEIVQKEQQVAGAVTKADADRVIAASVNRIAAAAAAQIDLTAAPAQAASTLAQLSPSVEELQEQMRDVSAFSHSKQVEMASTDDVLDMFSPTTLRQILQMLRTEAAEFSRRTLALTWTSTARCWNQLCCCASPKPPCADPRRPHWQL